MDVREPESPVVILVGFSNLNDSMILSEYHEMRAQEMCGCASADCSLEKKLFPRSNLISTCRNKQGNVTWRRAWFYNSTFGFGKHSACKWRH